MRTVTIVCAALLVTQVVIAQGSLSDESPTCGPISGQTLQDLDKVRTFCEALPKDAAVGAYATESVLVVRVSRAAAEQIRTDRARAEQLVLTWMSDWRRVSGSQSVTVTIRWGDIRTARGRTTPSGDQVTIP